MPSRALPRRSWIVIASLMAACEARANHPVATDEADAGGARTPDASSPPVARDASRDGDAVAVASDARAAPSEDASVPDAGETAVDDASVEQPAYDPVRFAVIGDFGDDTVEEGEVAALVRRLAPEFVITVGDNNYPFGEASTIDANIGAYYGDFISAGPDNRFFPSPGNHDWGTGNLDAYLSYFTLPGNERYYEFERGSVHLFALDSDPHEPDGITADSLQASWLRERLAASTKPFKVVYFHHPPYTSGMHGNNRDLAWPFAEWGASLVLAGHEHDYERLGLAPGVPLVVNGIGGIALRLLESEVVPESQLAYDELHGAMLIEADGERLEAFTYSTSGGVMDHFVLNAGLTGAELTSMPVAIARGSSFRASTSAPAGAWASPLFDDASWSMVSTPAGFGNGDEASELRPANMAVWLRREFELEQVPEHALMRLVCDDGAVVYLNGREVHRVNLPAGTIAPDTAALAPVAYDWERRAVETMLDVSSLVPGRNVIAIEVHQSAANSSDLRVDLELRVR